MPITTSRNDDDSRRPMADLPEAVAAAEEMSRVLASKRAKRGVKRNAEPDFKDEGFTASVYEKFNAKNGKSLADSNRE